MNTKQLRQKILDLAIRGQLVPQNPDEEPASVLLEKIRAEKETLIKEKKIKKDKKTSYITREEGTDKSPYPKFTEHFADGTTKEITQEIPFEIPKNWAWCRLGEIGHWAAGSTPSRKKTEYYNKGSIPWLKTGDLNDGYINNTAEFITDFALQKCSLRLNPIGSVLIAMYGATIGKLGILNIEATTNQACCACVPYLGVNNKFLFFYLYTQKRILQEKAEGGAQPNISKEKLCNFLFPLPPLAEQQRIVEKIEELLVWVEQLEQNKTELKTYLQQTKAKVLDEAIHGKLVPQNPDDEPASVLLEKIRNEQKAIAPKNKKTLHNEHYGEELPKGWIKIQMENICQLSDGDKKSNTELPYLDVKFLRGKDAGKIKNSGKFIAKNTHLILVDGENSGEIFKSEVDGYQGSTLKILNISKEMNQEYVFYILKKEQQLFKESKTGSAIPHLNKKLFKELPVFLPPLAEQRRIVEKIERIFSELELIEEILE
ncbi:restriction endonuclease subunit S [Riemerella columbina]|uniref:restriction endonuclease subunit S n=1 Tax=Riemerella columbina TaxID=103810 RepID=UPI00266F1B7F|nr:restriction endonuclease subunit S [Riemerella columbina]WKS94303.1 restriction endonuclease subunit S [Riemerella columbina]